MRMCNLSLQQALRFCSVQKPNDDSGYILFVAGVAQRRLIVSGLPLSALLRNGQCLSIGQ